ncbi:MAG: hypothetical protein V1928_03840 [Parcubacteria group bacterium]
MKPKENSIIQGIIKKVEEIKIDFIGTDTYVVGGALENRFLFNRLVEIIKNNPSIDKPNIFLDYIKINYVTTIIVAICRQIDGDKDSISLINLLYEIYNNAEKITKKWFVASYKTIGIVYGNRAFEENFGNLKHVDPAIIYADIGNLIFYTKKIKKFRNKRVAHLDKNKEIKFDINFETLNDAIDLMEKIVKKYYLLLTQCEMDKLLPGNVLCFRDDRSDEEDIFCVPWKNCKK